MAGETAMVKPTNKIVWDSINLHMETKKVETATNVYPGRLVTKGTNDDDVVVNTDGGAAVGWAGYLNTAKNYRPATVDTIYAQNDQIAVIYGPGMGVVGRLAELQNVAKGALLYAFANGELSAGTAGTHHIVARAAESVDASAAAADIMVVSLI
jgi:hypothetical protein